MLRTLLLTLTLSGPASALLLNSPAPVFTLPTGSGARWALADQLGRKRVLVVSRPPAAWLDEAARLAALLRDRDLLVVALVGSGDTALRRPQSDVLTVLEDADGQVAARYGGAALIGKDRGVKATYPAPPSLEAVMDTVDRMPMRQQERQTRGR